MVSLARHIERGEVGWRHEPERVRRRRMSLLNRPQPLILPSAIAEGHHPVIGASDREHLLLQGAMVEVERPGEVAERRQIFERRIREETGGNHFTLYPSFVMQRSYASVRA